MSPLRSSAGPATCRIETSSSRRMIWASEVFPRPGGPASSTWSSASPRPRAASSAIPSCSLTRSWPTNSARVAGRSELSSSSSPSSCSTGAMNRSLMQLSSRPPAPAPPRTATRRRPPARGLHRPETTRARREHPGPSDPHRAEPAEAGSPSLSFSSMTTRCAVFRPMPGIASNRARSSRAIARRSSAGGEPETIASATFGPIPDTPSSSSNSSRSSADANPYSWSASSRTWRCVSTVASSPTRRGHARRRGDEVADAADVEHEAGGGARDDGAAQARDHAGTVRAGSDAAEGAAGTSRGRSRRRARRPRGPARAAPRARGSPSPFAAPVPCRRDRSRTQPASRGSARTRRSRCRPTRRRRAPRRALARRRARCGRRRRRTTPPGRRHPGRAG